MHRFIVWSNWQCRNEQLKPTLQNWPFFRALFSGQCAFCTIFLVIFSQWLAWQRKHLFISFFFFFASSFRLKYIFLVFVLLIFDCVNCFSHVCNHHRFKVNARTHRRVFCACAYVCVFLFYVLAISALTWISANTMTIGVEWVS